MTLHWYKPPKPSASDLETYLDHLHVLGVRWHESWSGQGDVMYKVADDILMAEVGAITVRKATNVISVWPYRDLGHREAMVLAASAEKAFTDPPSKRTGWVFTTQGKTPRWHTAVLVAVKENGDLGRLVGAHQERMKNESYRAFKAACRMDVVSARQ